jgi:hypothetical protein
MPNYLKYTCPKCGSDEEISVCAWQEALALELDALVAAGEQI